jgi:hypothetical protein
VSTPPARPYPRTTSSPDCADPPALPAGKAHRPHGAIEAPGQSKVPTGRIVVPDCTDHLPGAARSEVPKRFVRVRASRANLADVHRPGQEGYEAPDLAAPHGARAVIKRWTASG